jgi:hypothetical protein
MVRIITVLAVFIAVMSCKKLEENNPDVIEQVNQAEGAFVINEGTFGWNNASLSYVNFKSAAISNQIYKGKNNKQLGDIFQSMIIHNGLGFLAIDQADVIKVININSLVESTVITELNGPRYMLADKTSEVLWVTQYSDVNLVGLNLNTYAKVFEIDLPDYDIDGIPIQSGSDQMVLWNNKLFVSNFRRPYVYQVNATNAVVEDSIYVGYGVFSLVIGNNNLLWVASSGDFNKNTQARLTCVDVQSNSVVDFVENVDTGFSNITFGAKNETVYVLNNGVKKVRLSNDKIELTAIIQPSSENSFYGLDVNPYNGEIWVTNALDFQQQGEVYQYNATGVLLNTYVAGYAPNALVFY